MIVEFSKALVGLPLLVAVALNQAIVYSPVQSQYEEALAAAGTSGIPGLLQKLESVANAFPGTPYAARAAEIIQVAIPPQTTDVEGEVNGLLTYDRRVEKLPREWLAQVHAPLAQR